MIGAHIQGRSPSGPHGQDRLKKALSRHPDLDVPLKLASLTPTGTLTIVKVLVLGHTGAVVLVTPEDPLADFHPRLAMTVSTTAAAADQSIEELEPFLKLGQVILGYR